MVATHEPADGAPREASSDGPGATNQSADTSLERTSRALRLAVDVVCLGLLFYAWLSAAEVEVGHLITLWLASCLAIPRSPITEQLRQHTVASTVILLLGIWRIADALSSTSFVMAGATLYSLRSAFQGLLFALAGVSNLLAAKAYPEHKTTIGSLTCGVAATASGIIWVWISMHAGAVS